MAEERHIETLDTSFITRCLHLVKTPHLLTIKTIKKKVLEQMQERHMSSLKAEGDSLFRVLGRCGPFAIVHSETIGVFRTHRNYYTDFVASILIEDTPKNERVATKKIVEESLQKFYDLPQIFEE